VSKNFFGTDGVRGRVGEYPITPEFVMHLGYSAGKVLASADWHLSQGENPGVLIGKDTRISGYLLESALQAGLIAAGVDVYLAGPMPTPANVMHESAKLGKAKRLQDAAGRYIEFCKSSFPYDLDLRGLKLVVDCAHGACYQIARHVFHELGADVVAIGVQPDGKNINDGYGATAPANLQQAVKDHHADLGIALDGDGDRLVMVDADGCLYDGDHLLYIIVKHRHAQGTLKGGVVGTLMTNLAFEHVMQRMHVPFARAKVGDRYVMEKMLQQGWQLGGENSGHIICLDRHTTGDGIISALQVLHALRINQQTLAQAASDLTLYPQILLNVRVARGSDCSAHTRIREVVMAAETALDGCGRVLLRPSGTEPLLRVMVEGEDGEKVRYWAEIIAQAVREVAQVS